MPGRWIDSAKFAPTTSMASPNVAASGMRQVQGGFSAGFHWPPFVRGLVGAIQTLASNGFSSGSPAASRLLSDQEIADGPDIAFNRSRTPRSDTAEAMSARAWVLAVGQSPETSWFRKPSEAERFDSFRLLPQPAKLQLLAFCVALTLQPKLAPADGEEATAYDVALSQTGADIAGCWRPTRQNYLGRISREQLLDAVWGSDVYDFPFESRLKGWLLRRNLRRAQSVLVASTAHGCASAVAA